MNEVIEKDFSVKPHVIYSLFLHFYFIIVLDFICLPVI